jgi:O-antigen ligase
LSRFKPSLFNRAAVAPFQLAVAGVPSAPADQGAVAPSVVPTVSTERSGPLETLGYVLICTYLISGFINEWTLRLFHTSAYISTVLLFLLPVILLLSSNRLRGLKHVTGRWWILFLFLLILDAPFSVWRGGTVTLLRDYISRAWILYFLVTAFMVTLSRCRGLLLVNITVSAIVLFDCFKLGIASDDGRLRIADSLFFANSNDLALQLLIGITQFAYLLGQKGVLKKIFATVCIGLSFMYMMRTGSRGSLLAAFAYGVLIFIFSRRKIMVVAVALALAVIGVATVPSMALRRLMLFGFNETNITSSEEGSAVGSELQRKELLKRSIVETLKHPLFGVGPGQFATYVVGEKEKKGEWASWVGTHNSYTQVSSECGIPAFVCYCAIVVLCFRLNYRVFRAARDNPACREAAGLSFTLLSGTFVYSIATFFFHMAYSGALPLLSAETVALYFAARPAMELAGKSQMEARAKA